jgi:hypothetical protein
MIACSELETHEKVASQERSVYLVWCHLVVCLSRTDPGEGYQLPDKFFLTLFVSYREERSGCTRLFAGEPTKRTG